MIGSSTGGPKALATILSRLPADLGAAIAIVQHVDAQFAAGMIDWLNALTPLPVKKASVGDRVEVLNPEAIASSLIHRSVVNR